MKHIPKFLSFCLLILLVDKAGAQSLPIPLEEQNAYENNTRSTDGKPGKRYWQNHSDYHINAELEPKTRVLTGKETVVYHNESPDTLRELVIRLYPDIFKKDSRRNRIFESVDIGEGVTIESVSVNGQKMEKFTRRGTNMYLPLKEIGFSKNYTLDIAWHYTLPEKTHNREGTYFEKSFMVGYWYPQVSVYDDIDGWDRFDYTGIQEFYCDFNNYEVEITIPSTHLVWATGIWQNPQEILNKKYLDLYKKSQQSDDIINIVTEEDCKKNNIVKSDKTHTFKFKAESVPNFVFSASDTYLWDATSLIVDDKTKRRTNVAAAYHPTSKDFYQVTGYARHCIDFFSHKLPGVPFPYPNMTIFNGSGGMEFPMMVNDGSFPDSSAAEVTAHEIAHTYFPFYMGINEKKYTWMEEGFAQFLPNEMEFTINGKTFKPQQSNARYYNFSAGRELDLPLMTPNIVYNLQSVHSTASYIRPALAYTFLKDMLGDELFGKTLREYMDRWHGKHPVPLDFFNTFNDYLKEDLSWYWKPWYYEVGYPDLAIKAVTASGNSTKITILKKGSLPVPVRVKVIFNDGTSEILKETARVWKNNSEFVFTKSFSKPVSLVLLGDYYIPDVKPKDNSFKVQ